MLALRVSSHGHRSFYLVLKLDLGATLLTPSQALALLAFIGVSAASGVPAGLLAYRTSLQDGMRARF